jgi:hypothetical protein
VHFPDGADVRNSGGVNSQEFGWIKSAFNSIKSLTNLMRAHANLEPGVIFIGLDAKSISSVLTRTVQPVL